MNSYISTLAVPSIEQDNEHSSAIASSIQEIFSFLHFRTE